MDQTDQVPRRPSVPDVILPGLSRSCRSDRCGPTTTSCSTTSAAPHGPTHQIGWLPVEPRPHMRMQEGVSVSQNLQIDPLEGRVQPFARAFDGLAELVHVGQERSRLLLGSADSRWTSGSSTRSTEYPGRNWTSPITANPASNLRSTVGFPPLSALPIRSLRQPSVIDRRPYTPLISESAGNACPKPWSTRSGRVWSPRQRTAASPRADRLISTWVERTRPGPEGRPSNRAAFVGVTPPY